MSKPFVIADWRAEDAANETAHRCADPSQIRPAESAPLAVIETHPIQYHAPVYRYLQSRLGVPVTAIYASDFSVAGYRDHEFGTTFRWDTDLMSGYSASFLSTVAHGGARTPEEASARGLGTALRTARPAAILLTGYSPSFHRHAWMVARRARVPILLRAETTDHARAARGIRETGRTAALRLLYRSCSRFLYVGRHSRAHFERLGIPADRLIFAPYCVDTTPFHCGEEVRAHLRRVTRERLGIAETDRVILFSGKLSPRKAPDLLLQAIRAVPSEIRDRMTVAFLGSGELRATLEQTATAPPPSLCAFSDFKIRVSSAPTTMRPICWRSPACIRKPGGWW